MARLFAVICRSPAGANIRIQQRRNGEGAAAAQHRGRRRGAMPPVQPPHSANFLIFF
ncbi:hypothetical protein [Blastochloris viridis]|uniref:hypothetical protein n=1 Tax=Blastochloris viridis TaxID=1079 RepID=UPI0012E14F82|nr:hypothetical protein [Blastochloris viridis]